MSSAKKKVELLNLFYLVSAVLLLLLSMLNMQNLSVKNTKVLGISVGHDLTEIKQDKKYWEELVSKNPTYYDGWIELYKLNLNLGDYNSALKAYEIAKRIDFNR